MSIVLQYGNYRQLREFDITRIVKNTAEEEMRGEEEQRGAG